MVRECVINSVSIINNYKSNQEKKDNIKASNQPLEAIARQHSQKMAQFPIAMAIFSFYLFFATHSSKCITMCNVQAKRCILAPEKDPPQKNTHGTELCRVPSPGLRHACHELEPNVSDASPGTDMCGVGYKCPYMSGDISLAAKYL